MRNTVRRVIVPGLLAAAGAAAIAYAAIGNRIDVLEETETTETITLQPFGPPDASPFGPSESGPSGFGPPGFEPPGFGPPGFDPPMKPITQQVKRKIQTVKAEPEYVVVREVTIGGVTLAGSVLKRTYSGKAPSLCPT